jgi:hypothetical protein
MNCFRRLYQHLLGNLVEGDVVVSVSIIDAGLYRRPISRGQKGTVVHEWKNSKGKTQAYEVEFLYSEGFHSKTYNVVYCTREEVELL